MLEILKNCLVECLNMDYVIFFCANKHVSKTINVCLEFRNFFHFWYGENLYFLHANTETFSRMPITEHKY